MVKDGSLLPGRSWFPDKKNPKAIILSVHGFNDYSNFFSEPGELLAKKHDIASYAFDQRGFGNTSNRGGWAGTKTYVEDVKSVLLAIKTRHLHIPIYLLGESMGGAVSILALTSETPPDIDGVILISPAIWGRKTMPFYQRIALWIGAKIIPSVKVSGKGLNIKASDNKEMLLNLSRDPLVIKYTRIGTINGLVDLMGSALEKSSEFSGPSLILFGEKDEIIPKKPTMKMLANLTHDETYPHRLAVYKDGYHMLTRDLQASIVIKDIASWINAPNQPLPSKADRRNLYLN